jgi:Right handed beta helix region
MPVLVALLLLLALPAAAGAGAGAATSDPACDRPTIEATPASGLQAALDRARPGDVIALAPGDYRGAVRSVRDGTAAAPIAICGPRTAVVRGTAYDQRVVEINHDHLILDGFTIDGLFGADPADKNSYAGKLVYAIGTRPGDGPSHNRFEDMAFENAGGECVRLRYFARRNEIAGSTFRTCGLYDFRFGEGGKNGEGVYIGTAPEQQGENGAPDKAKDRSDRNWIHGNDFVTRGNECVDIKENASKNLIESNRCTGQRDKESGGFDSRGNRNTFRFNTSSGNRGAGIRFGGDGRTDGILNVAYGNVIRDNGAYGIQMTRNPQRLICGNTIAGFSRADFRGPRAKLPVYRGACPKGTPTAPRR